MKKLNCWEITNCGREPGGFTAGYCGVCPAALDKSSSGINNGKNAGRICWAVAGTFCRSTIKGKFARENFSCVTCDVFKQVMTEEETETFHLLKAKQAYSSSHK